VYLIVHAAHGILSREKNCTILSDSTVKISFESADRIALLDHGHIVEEGVFSDLTGRSGGRFTRLAGALCSVL